MRGGTQADLDRRALACIHCDRFKGPNVAGHDPETGEIVRLFHPRHDKWAEHFACNGPELIRPTPIARVTITVPAMNDPQFVAVLIALREQGIF